jgi:hypothetical protein
MDEINSRNIYYTDNIISNLLKDFKNYKIDSSQVMSALSEMSLPQVKPIAKIVQYHVIDYLNFPEGGVWLDELVKGYKPVYLSFISFIGDPDISFKQFIEDNLKSLKDFESLFPEQSDIDRFWKIIDLISEELNRQA